MIAEVIIVVASQEREDEAAPKFTKISRNVMPELPDSISEQCVGSRVALCETEEGVGGKKCDSMIAVPVEPGDDGDRFAFNIHESMFRDTNTGILSKRKGKDLAGRDVSRIIGLGEFCNGQAAIGKGDGGLWSRTTQG